MTLSGKESDDTPEGWSDKTTIEKNARASGAEAVTSAFHSFHYGIPDCRLSVTILLHYNPRYYVASVLGVRDPLQGQTNSTGKHSFVICVKRLENISITISQSTVYSSELRVTTQEILHELAIFKEPGVWRTGFQVVLKGDTGTTTGDARKANGRARRPGASVPKIFTFMCFVYCFCLFVSNVEKSF